MIQVPPAGLCLSSFLFVENPKGEVLLGRPALHRAWPLKGSLPLWRVREIIQAGEWVLPASHLLFGEAPSAAAVRVARDWAGLPTARPEFVGVDSGTRPSSRTRGGRTQYHWDIGFLYRARAMRLPPAGPWWAETRFVGRRGWERLKVGRGHRDTLRAYARTPSG
jgi:ADP-ribose pyrophosphatase YjhB (NUDIX family)